MSWFETVNRYSVSSTININNIIFISTFQYLVLWIILVIMLWTILVINFVLSMRSVCAVHFFDCKKSCIESQGDP